MNTTIKKILGLLLIVGGLFIIFFAAWELILRLLVVFVGLYLVNWGTRLFGQQPLHWTVMRIWSRSRYDI